VTLPRPHTSARFRQGGPEWKTSCSRRDGAECPSVSPRRPRPSGRMPSTVDGPATSPTSEQGATAAACSTADASLGRALKHRIVHPRSTARGQKLLPVGGQVRHPGRYYVPFDAEERGRSSWPRHTGVTVENCQIGYIDRAAALRFRRWWCGRSCRPRSPVAYGAIHQLRNKVREHDRRALRRRGDREYTTRR